MNAFVPPIYAYVTCSEEQRKIRLAKTGLSPNYNVSKPSKTSSDLILKDGNDVFYTARVTDESQLHLFGKDSSEDTDIVAAARLGEETNTPQICLGRPDMTKSGWARLVAFHDQDGHLRVDFSVPGLDEQRRKLVWSKANSRGGKLRHLVGRPSEWILRDADGDGKTLAVFVEGASKTDVGQFRWFVAMNREEERSAIIGLLAGMRLSDY